MRRTSAEVQEYLSSILFYIFQRHVRATFAEGAKQKVHKEHCAISEPQPLVTHHPHTAPHSPYSSTGLSLPLNTTLRTLSYTPSKRFLTKSLVQRPTPRSRTQSQSQMEQSRPGASNSVGLGIARASLKLSWRITSKSFLEPRGWGS